MVRTFLYSHNKNKIILKSQFCEIFGLMHGMTYSKFSSGSVNYLLACKNVYKKTENKVS